MSGKTASATGAYKPAFFIDARPASLTSIDHISRAYLWAPGGGNLEADNFGFGE
jgi:hypothetical protein